MIQTDNGSEFNYTQKTKRTHPLDILCNRLHITHKTIRPATPWHNGKVERSHRNDQERFYNHLKFYSYADLQLQMKRYLRRSNRIPMSVLGWKTPIQKREELEAARFCWLQSGPPSFRQQNRSPKTELFLFFQSHIIDKPTTSRTSDGIHNKNSCTEVERNRFGGAFNLCIYNDCIYFISG